jgi:hypothetical protein
MEEGVRTVVDVLKLAERDTTGNSGRAAPRALGVLVGRGLGLGGEGGQMKGFDRVGWWKAKWWSGKGRIGVEQGGMWREITACTGSEP